ncbi:MAG TPA: HAMP domain-containing sensor histidine kinase, partial [Chthoniobacterales bacterium]
IAASSLTLLLIWRGYFQAGFLLQTFASIVVFTITGTIYFNASENYLLLTMAVVVFVMEPKSRRIPVAMVCALAFVLVKISHFASFETGRVPLDRYVLNIFIFTLAFYAFLEIFRKLIGDYLARIEASNAELARQRIELHEERARLKRANQAKEKLFSMVAHDLRGPVGNLKTAMEGLEEGFLSGEDFRGLQADLRLGVKRVYASLDDLLLWAAGQMHGIEAELENVPLKAVAQEMIELLQATADAKRITLRNGLAEEVVVRADRHQIGTVIRNLLANAIKFTPESGAVEVSAAREGARWKVAISDNGVGMNAEVLARLFNSEVAESAPGTRNEKGWGLGLQICRDFITANGGRIWAESRPRRGTTFHFTLASAE